MKFGCHYTSCLFVMALLNRLHKASKNSNLLRAVTNNYFPFHEITCSLVALFNDDLCFIHLKEDEDNHEIISEWNG